MLLSRQILSLRAAFAQSSRQATTVLPSNGIYLCSATYPDDDADPREHRRASERRLRQLRLLCVPKRRVDIAFFHFARITVCPAFFPNPVNLVVIAAQIKDRVDNPEEKNREYREADHPHARLPPKIRRRRLKPSGAQAPLLLNFALDQACHRRIRKLLESLAARPIFIALSAVARETLTSIPHGIYQAWRDQQDWTEKSVSVRFAENTCHALSARLVETWGGGRADLDAIQETWLVHLIDFHVGTISGVRLPSGDQCMLVLAGERWRAMM
jgi:hypothetical protein